MRKSKLLAFVLEITDPGVPCSMSSLRPAIWWLRLFAEATGKIRLRCGESVDSRLPKLRFDGSKALRTDVA
jgi:hypothetical protein